MYYSLKEPIIGYYRSFKPLLFKKYMWV